MRQTVAFVLLCLMLAAHSFSAQAASENIFTEIAQVETNERQIPVEDLAREITLRYQGITPSQWREGGAGIVSVLPYPSDCSIGQNGSTNALPNACRGQMPQRGVALTLDACDGKTDMRIIALLRELLIPATLFVTNRWLRDNAELAADLAADPLFSLEAHGVLHKPASVAGWSAYGITGTKNIPALVVEVEDNAWAIAAITGKKPRWYRSGTAFYDDVALRVIQELNFSVAGFSINADQGATLSAKTVAKRLLSAKDGDILLLHINHPESGTFKGLKEALPKMVEAGIQFVGL